jgi:ABC-type spermidine/putrescine transport system permease subunit II
MNGLHFHCHDGEIVDISYLAWPLAAAAGTLLISSHVQRILRVVFPIETPAMATGFMLALR